MTLNSLLCADVPLSTYTLTLYELCASFDRFRSIYTDGSKMDDRVASAATSLHVIKSARLPNSASIFRAELYAVKLVMDFVCHSKDSNFSFFSDSLSSLEALSEFKLELGLVQKSTRLGTY